MMKMILFVLFSLMMLNKKMFWKNQMNFFILFFFMMFSNINLFYFTNLSYKFGMDILSYSLILLSIWIFILMFKASSKIYFNNIMNVTFLFVMMMLILMLICTFSAMDLFLFYVYFESSLIPIMLLIMGWGYQPERLQAGLYLLFYTLFVSLPMLMGIFYIYKSYNLMMICMFSKMEINLVIMYVVMFMAFLVKLPMIFVHLWLPKAHVEAPVSGSMILAAIMLKLGAYGMMRLLIMFMVTNSKFSFYLVSISLIGGVYLSLLCLHQVDLKSLIAYSSVVHMSMVLAGLLTLNYWGFMSSLILLIGHGLCSSGLFCLINMNYERIASRSFYLNKGLLNIMPLLSMWWFLFVSSNMAAPPSLNLFGEIGILNSLINWSFWLMVVLIFLSFFSASYSLYLYMYSQHGKFIFFMNNYFNCVCREYLLLFLHWVPLNLLILKMDFLLLN
uniref:NADH-ubiquinone oxidoreductase chain 4 n=1 Tax=Anisocentropus maculatus TaxID=2904904 RepID=A0A9E8LNP3_9NEOP|nr:NADH dehydrogenase subunit 4 [Anisocentropus maculatus]UZZ43761.1 NADH dehydrogenase subunit 4 [Anisocentropus maculatus]